MVTLDTRPATGTTRAFNVLQRKNGKLVQVDRVFYAKSDPITADEVHDSLVKHDGFPPHIRVVEDVVT